MSREECSPQSFIVEMCVPCTYEGDDHECCDKCEQEIKDKIFDFTVAFSSLDDFEIYDGDCFDMLGDIINDCLPDGWYVEGFPECVNTGLAEPLKYHCVAPKLDIEFSE